MSDQANSVRMTIDFLIEPHPDITGTAARQRARTLAALSLMLTTIGVVVVWSIIWVIGNQQAWYGMPHLAFLLMAYVISRTPWAGSGAFLLVLTELALNVGFLVGIPDPGVAAAMLTFLLLPLLFSTLLLSARVTLGFVALTDVIVVAVSLLAPWIVFNDVIIPLLGTILISGLASITAFLRERDLALIQKQADALGRRSETLATEIDERMGNILATAEVGRAITGMRDVDAMIRQVMNLITDRFNYYYAQVLLIDPTGKQAVLKAGTGPTGEELLSRQYKEAVGAQSAVGMVTATGESVVVSDTDIDPIHRRNELLPLTRAEIAMPLRASGRVIGALNIQSVTPNAFDQIDLTVFQTMADQLAVAIENANLFDQAKRDLEDIEMLNRQLTGEAWRKYLAGRSEAAPVGFAASQGGVAPILPNEQGTGEPNAAGSITLPLKVRGETIGELEVTPRSGRVPDDETKSMLEAVAERVALALDSTRLGEHAQHQAEREQILSAISAELQATTDMDAILRIVARESSQALGAVRGFVHLAMVYGSEQEQASELNT